MLLLHRKRGGYALSAYIKIVHDLMHAPVPLIFGQKPYAEHQVQYLVADISALARDTGFHPAVSFEEGIRRILSSS